MLAKNYVNGSIKNLKLGNTKVVAGKIKALLPDADMNQHDTGTINFAAPQFVKYLNQTYG